MNSPLAYILFWLLFSIAGVVFSAVFCGKGEPISPDEDLGECDQEAE